MSEVAALVVYGIQRSYKSICDAKAIEPRAKWTTSKLYSGNPFQRVPWHQFIEFLESVSLHLAEYRIDAYDFQRHNMPFLF